MNNRIKKYLRQGEGDELDYKQEISSANKIAKTMVSFANHRGGTLLVGVRDNRTIAGIRTEDEKYMLELAAGFYCKPEIQLKTIEHEIGGKVILECIVPEGESKPYYAKGEDDKWWVYVRSKDKSLLASKVTVDVLRRQASNSGTYIKYGKNEEMLLKYLEDNERITLHEFRKKVNISKWRASKILVNLISAGVIRIHTHEKTEFYTLV
ncbi:putative DNA binding domain-containing protein [Bacteroidia bacterium]|nr:putative DNA binding domain-containing protein [Bacteroidia bacterium]MDB4107015.1 putative DNA binding domain-containing protein [Bacteroidia bacterium]MDB9882474.1 putative DNA binding domain-containing protein [Bacteroidia bacterium]